MDADYFPRLSAAVTDARRMNTAINRQIDALVLLLVPFLIVFVLALPLLVRLLYTSAFLPIVPMIVCAVGYMFFKAMFSPVAYLPLAAGHSLTYMAMELAYDLPFVGFVIVGYHLGGLTGAGIGLTLSNAYNFLLVWGVYAHRYGFRPNAATVRRSLLQAVCLAVGIFAAWQTDALVRYGVGIAALLASVVSSWQMLRRETAIGERLRRLLKRGHRASS